MQKLKRALRNGVLYISAVVLVVSPSLTAHAADDETYYYDQSSGRWNSSKWTYDAATNTYLPVVPTPSPAPAQSTDNTSGSPTNNEPSTDTSADSPAVDSTINGTGPSSNNQIDQNTDTNSNTAINNGTKITNGVNSDATSGNAGVTQNTKGGNAQTGNASADATIVNSVHSTVGNGANSGVANFTIDLYGDVHGDIVIGPDTMGTNTVSKNTNINSNTNVNNSDSITNNVALNATSGDATVKGNTVAGSAQSGDAKAVVNLLNLVNTVIAANQSFVGTINIHGNLNGDILMSPEFIPQLLGSNADSKVEQNYNMPLSTNINDDQTIVNNVDLNATSGTATVKDNTSAGTASTGDAQTSLQVLNLTGHEVVAENSVLVFVNVKGKWIGMILDAPGATAAAFGSGVIANNITAASSTNVNNKAAITNNINVTAVSGDANVESNTSGGDAKTGNASASANIANISNSKFTLSGWFAVLYINIDGDWTGLALKNSDAGDEIAAVVPLASSEPQTQQSVGKPNVRLGYVPKVAENVSQVVGAAATNDKDPYAAAVLASAVQNDKILPTQTLKQTVSPRQDPFSTILMIGGFGVAGISALSWVVRRILGR